MTGRKIIVLLLGASAIGGAACLFMVRAARLFKARTVRCDEIVEQLVRSPDGESVATSTLKACPVGVLSSTNYSVSVALSLKLRASSSTNETSGFESADASEVRVNDVGEVRVSKHEAEGVR